MYMVLEYVFDIKDRKKVHINNCPGISVIDFNWTTVKFVNSIMFYLLLWQYTFVCVRSFICRIRTFYLATVCDKRSKYPPHVPVYEWTCLIKDCTIFWKVPGCCEWCDTHNPTSVKCVLKFSWTWIRQNP